MDLIETPIIHKVLIKAPRKKVYDLMTTAKGLDSWFTKGTEINLKKDGKFVLRWKDWGPDKVTNTANCVIQEVKAPKTFVFKWWEDHYTTVEMDFEQEKEGTVITLKESGYQNNEEGHKRCLECATGWGEALTLLKFYAEHGITY